MVHHMIVIVIFIIFGLILLPCIHIEILKFIFTGRTHKHTIEWIDCAYLNHRSGQVQFMATFLLLSISLSSSTFLCSSIHSINHSTMRERVLLLILKIVLCTQKKDRQFTCIFYSCSFLHYYSLPFSKRNFTWLN